MINWEKVTKEDYDLIGKVVDRTQAKSPHIDKTSLNMDLAATIASGTNLNLNKLLEFDDLNFAHDVFGIMRHIDRNTGNLTQCFLPRCTD